MTGMTRRRFLTEVAACAITGTAISRRAVGQSRGEGLRLARPTPQQLAWQDMELGLFIHFGLFICGSESVPDPNVYNPTTLDTDQWLEAARAMGAEYAVFTAKHGTGFMQWQSDAYPYGLKQTKWRSGKGDVVKEFVESCHKYKIKPGLYACVHFILSERSLTGLTGLGRPIHCLLHPVILSTPKSPFRKPLAETKGTGKVLELGLRQPARIDHVILMEDIAHGERVRKYVVEGLIAGGEWKQLCAGVSIGHKRIQKFDRIEVAKVRFHATESVAEPRIRRMAVYDTRTA